MATGGASDAPSGSTIGENAPPKLGWNRLQSYSATRKENEPRATQWAGVRMPQRKGAVPAAAPVLEIPADDDLVDMPTPQKGSAVTEVRS